MFLTFDEQARGIGGTKAAKAVPHWGVRGERCAPPESDHCAPPDSNDQNVSGSVRRTQRPPFTTARNDELAPWCFVALKLASGPLKMSL